MICLATYSQFHIIRDYNHRRSSDTIGLRWKIGFPNNSRFLAFFFGDHEVLFFTNRTNFVYQSTSAKNSKSLMLEVATVLKLTLFPVRSRKALTCTFFQIFPLTPAFCQYFDNKYYGMHNTKI